MSVERKCVYCQLSDDHPKHEQVHPGHVSVYAHMDCCAQFTGCELCEPVVDGANGKRGDELRKFLTSFYAKG